MDKAQAAIAFIATASRVLPSPLDEEQPSAHRHEQPAKHAVLHAHGTGTARQPAQCAGTGGIAVLHAEPRTEHEAAYDRTLGYESLTVRLLPPA